MEVEANVMVIWVLLSFIAGFLICLYITNFPRKEMKKERERFLQDIEVIGRYEEFIKYLAIGLGAVMEAENLDKVNHKDMPAFFKDYLRASMIFLKPYHNKGYKDALEKRESRKFFKETSFSVELINEDDPDSRKNIFLDRYFSVDELTECIKQEYDLGYTRGELELQKKED